MENFILSEHLILASLLAISIVCCIIAGYLVYISNSKESKIYIDSNKLLLTVSILYFIITFYLTYISYFQIDKKNVQLCDSNTNLNESIPETKDQGNVLFLKTYLKTYYREIPDEIENIIAKAVDDLSCKHGVDFDLVVGMIGVESSFNPYAVSKIGARGLMQVRYGVWKNHLEIPNITKLHNIYEGIEYGILAFLQCRKEAKDNLIKALQKYSGTKGSDYINKISKEIDRFMLLKQDKGESINDSQFN